MLAVMVADFPGSIWRERKYVIVGIVIILASKVLAQLGAFAPRPEDTEDWLGFPDQGLNLPFPRGTAWACWEHRCAGTNAHGRCRQAEDDRGLVCLESICVPGEYLCARRILAPLKNVCPKNICVPEGYLRPQRIFARVKNLCV